MVGVFNENIQKLMWQDLKLAFLGNLSESFSDIVYRPEGTTRMNLVREAKLDTCLYIDMIYPELDNQIVRAILGNWLDYITNFTLSNILSIDKRKSKNKIFKELEEKILSLPLTGEEPK